MPEKDWLYWMSCRNYFNIDFHKYNNKKGKDSQYSYWSL